MIENDAPEKDSPNSGQTQQTETKPATKVAQASKPASRSRTGTRSSTTTKAAAGDPFSAKGGDDRTEDSYQRFPRIWPD